MKFKKLLAGVAVFTALVSVGEVKVANAGGITGSTSTSTCAPHDNSGVAEFYSYYQTSHPLYTNAYIGTERIKLTCYISMCGVRRETYCKKCTTLLYTEYYTMPDPPHSLNCSDITGWNGATPIYG